MTKEHGTRGSVPHIDSAVEQFLPQRVTVRSSVYGSGNINETFLIAPDASPEGQFILQRLNRRIFVKPELIMRNLRTLSEHVLSKLKSFPLNAGRRWEIPRVLPARDSGNDYWVDPDGFYWRALSFIDHSVSPGKVEDLAHAHEIGFALGLFHSLVSDLPVERMADTLQGFHITPLYLERYDQVLASASPARSASVRRCLEFIERRRAFGAVLEEAHKAGCLHSRIIHGDPKASNILLDRESRKAVALIDLDTVKPGLLHYDLGDCLRSCCNASGESVQNPDLVRFEPDFCREILKGYFSMARGFITRWDKEYLFDSVRLIAFELGLRFFTDYLEGNIYFKVRSPEHNLLRALVQFRLTESVESQERAIRNLVREMA